METAASPVFVRNDKSSSFSKWIKLTLQTLCPLHSQSSATANENECRSCDRHTEHQLLTLMHDLTGIDPNAMNATTSNNTVCDFDTFIQSTLAHYSSDDRLYFIKSLSMAIQHTNIQSLVHQAIVQLLYQIINFNGNWCIRLCDDSLLIRCIIRQILQHEDAAMLTEYHNLLQFFSASMNVRKIANIKALVEHFVDVTITCSYNNSDQDEQQQLSILIILYNILKSKHGSSFQRDIKHLPSTKMKAFLKTLSRCMSHSNMWLVCYSLTLLTKLVVNDALQSQLFNASNINVVFQLVFNLVLYGVNKEHEMLQLSVDLFACLLSNDEMIAFLSQYPKLRKTMHNLLPLLLRLHTHPRNHNNNNNHQNSSNDHCLYMLKLLNLMAQCNKLQLMLITLLRDAKYLSVIAKLCLFHSDFAVATQAVKLLTTIIKSQYVTFNMNEQEDAHQCVNICDLCTAKRHAIPAQKPSSSSVSANLSLQSIASMTLSLQSDSIVVNDRFLDDVQTMCFVEDACNALFGHNDMGGNDIMRKLCFMGQITDYALLLPPQKYVMLFVELLNVLCQQSSAFKSGFAAAINISDIAFFLCPSKHVISGQRAPNQIFLSLVNFICALSDDIVGVSYLFKTSFCDPSVIAAIFGALNSKCNAKDVSNAVQFIHNVFDILSKPEAYDGNDTFIDNVVRDGHGDGDENEHPNTKKRRRNGKHKPRQYGRGGLTLTNASRRETATSTASASTMDSDVYSENFNNVQNMSSKTLYQLFCKKMLRFNKMHNTQSSEQHNKQMEMLKIKFGQKMEAMEKSVDAKKEEIEKLREQVQQMSQTANTKRNECETLRQRLNDVNEERLRLSDDVQTKKHVIRDNAEKMEEMRMENDALRTEHEQQKRECAKQQNENAQQQLYIQEISNKLKCVCEGYNALKTKCSQQVSELQQSCDAKLNDIQQQCDQVKQALNDETKNRERLETQLETSQTEKKELKKRLDCVIQRNSDLNHACHQKDKAIEALNKKQVETQKLASMIQNLMNQKSDS